MNSNDIYEADFIQSLPVALRKDQRVVALAQVMAERWHQTIGLIPETILYARIGQLSEKVLDILAYDLKVDWYDYDYPLETKRETIQNAMTVHRKKGTKFAVETAISEIYRGAKVLEWFEYGGAPYHFKLLLDASYETVAPEKHKRVLERVAFYQNLRSVLEQVEYAIIPLGAATAYVGCAAGCVHMAITAEVKVYGLDQLRRNK